MKIRGFLVFCVFSLLVKNDVLANLQKPVIKVIFHDDENIITKVRFGDKNDEKKGKNILNARPWGIEVGGVVVKLKEALKKGFFVKLKEKLKKALKKEKLKKELKEELDAYPMVTVYYSEMEEDVFCQSTGKSYKELFLVESTTTIEELKEAVKARIEKRKEEQQKRKEEQQKKRRGQQTVAHMPDCESNEKRKEEEKKKKNDVGECFLENGKGKRIADGHVLDHVLDHGYRFRLKRAAKVECGTETELFEVFPDKCVSRLKDDVKRWLKKKDGKIGEFGLMHEGVEKDDGKADGKIKIFDYNPRSFKVVWK